jgi:hypothetical protein
MKNSGLFALAAVAVTAVACSLPTPKSNDGNGEGEGCDYNLSYALQEASGAGSSCASCAQAQCGSQINTYEGSGGCGPYLSCICPGGTATTNQSTIESCSTMANTSACSTSAKAFNTCVDDNCASPCNVHASTGDGG